jgi:hypothetical protein
VATVRTTTPTISAELTDAKWFPYTELPFAELAFPGHIVQALSLWAQSVDAPRPVTS